jgi:predicted amidohydrolase YtcJ
MFLEDRIGSIEVSKRADIAIWDHDLYSLPTDKIKDIKCVMTLFGGKVVYTAPDSPLKVRLR